MWAKWLVKMLMYRLRCEGVCTELRDILRYPAISCEGVCTELRVEYVLSGLGTF